MFHRLGPYKVSRHRGDVIGIELDLLQVNSGVWVKVKVLAFNRVYVALFVPIIL